MTQDAAARPRSHPSRQGPRLRTLVAARLIAMSIWRAGAWCLERIGTLLDDC